MSHLQYHETHHEMKVSLHTNQTNKAYAHNKILAFLGNVKQDFSVSTIKKNILQGTLQGQFSRIKVCASSYAQVHLDHFNSSSHFW